jgi:hypothetical protein
MSASITFPRVVAAVRFTACVLHLKDLPPYPRSLLAVPQRDIQVPSRAAPVEPPGGTAA